MSQVELKESKIRRSLNKRLLDSLEKTPNKDGRSFEDTDVHDLLSKLTAAERVREHLADELDATRRILGKRNRDFQCLEYKLEEQRIKYKKDLWQKIRTIQRLQGRVKDEEPLEVGVSIRLGEAGCETVTAKES